MMKRCSLVVLLLSVACVAETGFEDEDKGRQDWRNNHRLMSDAVFQDTAITAAQLQQFLEKKPTMRGDQASWLAEARIGSSTFATRLQAISRQHRVNPIVILAYLQMNSGVVAPNKAPAISLQNSAAGCTCPSNVSCGDGLEGQIECIARGLRADFNAVSPKDGLPVQDGSNRVLRYDAPLSGGVAPMNRSTMAIINRLNLDMRGADLFYALFTQYVGQLTEANGTSFDRLLELPEAEGFIGGACTTNSDCLFDGGVCQGTSDGKRICTLACEANALCPDRLGAPTTYCVSSTSMGMSGGAAYCVSQCGAGGSCRDGFECTQNVARHGQTAHTRNVCTPDGTTGTVRPGGCTGSSCPCTGSGCTTEPPAPMVDPNGRWAIKIHSVAATPLDESNWHWDSPLAGNWPEVMIEIRVNNELSEITGYKSDTFEPVLNETLFASGLNLNQIRSEDMTMVVWDADVGADREMGSCELDIPDSWLLNNIGPRNVPCGKGISTQGRPADHMVRLEIIKLATAR